MRAREKQMPTISKGNKRLVAGAPLWFGKGVRITVLLAEDHEIVREEFLP
jgi:hypothetical protein